jgi:acyl-CoA hydrolase
MRESFDISWITAHLYAAKQTYPELLRVDQVLFLAPVEIGSTIKFVSKVTFAD